LNLFSGYDIIRKNEGDVMMSGASIEEILNDFHTVSGMDISVVDRDFHTVSLSRCKGETVCSALHRDIKAIDVCKVSDIERLTAVKSGAKPLLYTCPFGITEAIVPIIRDGEAIGYIISALGIEESGVEDVIELSTVARDSDKALILSEIDKARKLTDTEIGAYFNMMKVLAEYIANDDTLLGDYESIGQLIKRYVKNNLARKLTLNEIARNLHCSTVTLTEHFKREFGITINEYITKKRMSLAEKLLLSTDKPLREIAALCGFPDVEYFSRTFKKFHDISPASWRREKGEKPNDNT
jgi:AraC-like DNA-binding protein